MYSENFIYSQELSSEALSEIKEQEILKEKKLPWKLPFSPHNLPLKDFVVIKLSMEIFETDNTNFGNSSNVFGKTKNACLPQRDLPGKKIVSSV